MRATQISSLLAAAVVGAAAAAAFLAPPALPEPPREVSVQGSATAATHVPSATIARGDIAAPAAVAPAEPTAAPDTAHSLREPREPAKPARFSEADFGAWMDASLDTDYLDRAATGVASEQAEVSLREVPHVRLAGMQCGERFCRASLEREPGEKADVSPLFGLPPFSFADSGFTIEEPDGSVKLYFTRGNGALSDLRAEAQGLTGGGRQ